MLSSVKEGDSLIFRSRHYPEGMVVRVSHTTKTQVVCGNRRYRRSDGHLVGSNDAWVWMRVSIPQEGELETVRQRAEVRVVVDRMLMLSVSDVTYEQAQKIKEIFGWD